MKWFINFSNHSTSKWSEKQIAEAEKFGRIVDVPFPNIPPEASTKEVKKMIADTIREAIFYYDEEGESTVQRRHITFHVMGEMTAFFYSVVFAFDSELFERVVVSTTERKSIEKDGIKTSIFEFIQFRAVENPFPERIKTAFEIAKASGSTAAIWGGSY